MKKIIFLMPVILIITSVLGANNFRVVKLRILDLNKPQPMVKVVVVYPDELRTCGTTITLNSDSEGYVQFTLPKNVFWLTVPSLNQHVVGQQFNVPVNTPADLCLDVRPREWQREVEK